MRTAFRALAGGAAAVLMAPHLIVVVLFATLLAAAPFGAWLSVRLQTALAGQPLRPNNPAEIDPEWWLEYRSHATGIEATFTPAIVGFAAPLGNLSALLDGTPQPLVLIVPAAIAAITWAFLWGGLLSRFARRGRIGVRAFAAASRHYWMTFIQIAALAVVGQAILYLTVHRLLFGPVFNAFASREPSEQSALIFRMVLYVIFGSGLAAVSLMADYARALAVGTGQRRVPVLVAEAWRVVKTRTGPVVTVFLLTGALFVALLVLYGTAETTGGSRLGGWRAIALGQAYILARLTIRLLAAASEVRLLQVSSEIGESGRPTDQNS
jgi:hypothetical protein